MVGVELKGAFRGETRRSLRSGEINNYQNSCLSTCLIKVLEFINIQIHFFAMKEHGKMAKSMVQFKY